MFVLRDIMHDEGRPARYKSRDDALYEARTLASISWDLPPNRTPCMQWRTCRREWTIIEYDYSVTPWHEIGRVEVVAIGSAGVIWSPGFEP